MPDNNDYQRYKKEPLSVAVLATLAFPYLASASTALNQPTYQPEVFPTTKNWTVSETLNSSFTAKKLQQVYGWSGMEFKPYESGFDITTNTLVYADNSATVKRNKDNLIRLSNGRQVSFGLNHSSLRLLYENSYSPSSFIRIDRNSHASFNGDIDSSFELAGEAERAIFIRNGSLKIQTGDVWIQLKPDRSNPNAIVQIQSGSAFVVEANKNLIVLADQTGGSTIQDGILNANGTLSLNAKNILIGSTSLLNKDVNTVLLNLNGINTIGAETTETVALQGGRVGMKVDANMQSFQLITKKLQIIGDGHKQSVGIKLIGNHADTMNTRGGDSYIANVDTGIKVGNGGTASSGRFVFDRLWDMASNNAVDLHTSDLDLTVNQYAYFDKDIKADDGYLNLNGNADFVVNGAIRLDYGSRLFGSPQSLSTSQLIVANRSSVTLDSSHVNLKSDHRDQLALRATANSSVAINTKNNFTSNLNVIGDIEISNGASVEIGFLNNHSVFKGSVLVPSQGSENIGAARLTFKDGAQWDVTRSNTHPVALNLNKGAVNLGDVNQNSNTVSNPVILSLSGLSGNDGLFTMRTSVEKPLGDSLYVTQGEGNHRLALTSTGLEPNENALNRALVTQANGSMALTLVNGQVDLGNHVYYLAQRKTNTGTEWYLKAPTPTPEPQPEPKPDPEIPVAPDKPTEPTTPLSPSATAVLALASTGAQNTQFLYGLSDLRERMGDVRYKAADGLYATVRGGKDRLSGFASTSYKNEYGAVGLGYDCRINSNWIAGLSFEAIKGDQEVTTGNYQANGEDETQSLKLYSTWYNDVGYYTDFVLGINRFQQDISTAMLDGRQVNGGYISYGYGISTEVGKKISFGAEDSWFIEPQAQLSYFYAKGRDFKLSNGMSVHQNNADSLTGRLGISAGRTFLTANETGFQFSVKTGINHEFLDDTSVVLNDEQFDGDSLGTRVYYGLAMDWYVSDNVRFFGHIEREDGSHFTREINAKLGVKYQF